MYVIMFAKTEGDTLMNFISPSNSTAGRRLESDTEILSADDAAWFKENLAPLASVAIALRADSGATAGQRGEARPCPCHPAVVA